MSDGRLAFNSRRSEFSDVPSADRHDMGIHDYFFVKTRFKVSNMPVAQILK